MAATTWLPYTYTRERRPFLLANGDVVVEPDLEETSTGRKVRLAGQPNTSHYSRDEDLLVRRGLDQIASKRKTRVWMPVDLGERVLGAKAGFTPSETRAVFDPTIATAIKTRAWWLFQHPSIPAVKALLYVEWRHARGNASGHRLWTRLAVQDQLAKHLHPEAQIVVGSSFSGMIQSLELGQREAFLEFVGEDTPEWLKVLETRDNMVERGAVSALMKKVRTLEELDEIQIPDLRDATRGNFDWLTLKLVDTNVTGRFLQDMSEYVTSEDLMAQAREIYGQLVDTFKTIGMVMPGNLADSDLVKAMTSGDRDALTVRLTTPVRENLTDDVGHIVSVHLPTGTFVVSCTKGDDKGKDDIAHAWEESKVLASLTGKEDELLAYAREYVRTAHDRRTTTAVKRRKTAFNIT